ncbi:Trehalose/maltose import ATP-binding protein MalK [Candidatus Burarchaeum australiense]|nr:Trehalose/maltose import ATP-binding protein MalK [Candidatus Burarchaeum australiense]
MSAAEEYVIECQGLTRKFGSFTAVDSLNLRIRKGEFFGFLGPNGAGKTTTIRMLTTLLSPSAGWGKVAGFDVTKEAASVRSRIGVVPKEFALFDDLTPVENLWYIGELYCMSLEKIRSRTDELLRVVGLYDKKDVVSEGFSGGMRQRLSIAASLLHIPEILFMDEPTIGLDPQSRISLRALIKKLNETGITIVYTTHDMEEADKLCDIIGIMNNGKLVAIGTSQELKDKYGGNAVIELELENPDKALLASLQKFSGASAMNVKGGKVELIVGKNGGAMLHSVSAFLSKKGASVLELSVKESSLEDVFINLTKGTEEGV